MWGLGLGRNRRGVDNVGNKNGLRNEIGTQSTTQQMGKVADLLCGEIIIPSTLVPTSPHQSTTSLKPKYTTFENKCLMSPPTVSGYLKFNIN